MRRKLVLSCLQLFVLLPVIVVAQGTQADYDRANSLRERTRNTVFRRKVEANWGADGKRLWYRVETASGAFEFVIADASKQNRELAFDHQKIAEQLAEATKKSVKHEKLPLQHLSLVDGEDALEFTAFSAIWKYERDSDKLTRLRDAESPGKTDAPRKNGGRGPSKRREQEGQGSPDGKWI
ncbi:MAG: hypothetical protein ACI93T_000973, partial [Porticoccaceae bacterium]